MQPISTGLGRKNPESASPIALKGWATPLDLRPHLENSRKQTKQLGFSAPLGSSWTLDGFKFSPCLLQKLREFLEGSNLITKLQAKHDLLQRTLGEGQSPGANRE